MSLFGYICLSGSSNTYFPVPVYQNESSSGAKNKNNNNKKIKKILQTFKHVKFC